MLKIAIPNDLITQPLVYGLDVVNKQTANLSAALIYNSLADNCRSLLQNTVDAAIVSPLDYARNSSELAILSDVAVFSTRRTQNALLFFRENLRQFHTISVLKNHTTYQVLAELLFKEYFEVEPRWEEIAPTNSDVNELLNTKKAVFLENDTAYENIYRTDRYLDILEEWHDKTGIPFIHQLIVLKRDSDPAGIRSMMNNSLNLGIRNLHKIAECHAKTGKNSEGFYLERISEDFQYIPTDETWDSLKEFFQYLYYYGYIDDIPELRFAER